MNQTWKTIVAVFVTATIIGGGVYYWQQNKIQLNPSPNIQPSVSTTPVAPTPQPTPSVAKVKSIDDYMNTYEKSPTTLPDGQFEQLVGVFALGFDKCTSQLDSEFCTPEMIKEGNYLRAIGLISDEQWSDGKDHEFYIECCISRERRFRYYGPFKDNVSRLKQEASQKENFFKF